MSATDVSQLYDAHYYATGCGLPYSHQEPHWPRFFGAIADRIVADFRPGAVLDAGCALGFLVQALRERGAEAYGIDVSSYAVEHAAPSVRPFCRVASVTEPLARRYDLIVCIEVLEHLRSTDAEQAVHNLCEHSDNILFSSSPSDYKEATHFNVQPPDYWAEHFARHGFYRDLDYTASFVTPWAVRFRRGQGPFSRVVRSYERRLWCLDQETKATRELIVEGRNQAASREAALQEKADELQRFRQALAESEGRLARLQTDHDKAVHSLLHESGAREQLTRCEAEISGRDDRIRAMAKAFEEFERILACERADLVLAREENEALRVQDESRGQSVRFLSDELRRLEQTASVLRLELADIRASRSWWLMQGLRRLRLWMFPARALHSRVLRLGIRGGGVLRREGVSAFTRKSLALLRRRLHHNLPSRSTSSLPAPSGATASEPPTDPSYALWIKHNEPGDFELEQQRKFAFASTPKISLVVPTYRTPLGFLAAMVESVKAQTYPHWELCVADGGSEDIALRAALEGYALQDSRIRVTFLTKNLGIAGNSNEALALATGDYVALLDHDDVLAPSALYEIARTVDAEPQADLLYSDEDKINAAGDRRLQPHFKPNWSPDALRSHNYICHLAVFRRELMQSLGGFRTGFDGSQDYDLILRATEQARRIVHIPKVLYHWRMHGQSCASEPQAKMYAYESARKALRGHLARSGLRGEVENGVTLGVYRVRYPLTKRPLVSVIVSNKDNHRMLDRCLQSVSMCRYSPYEVIVVENNSEDPTTFDYYHFLERRPNIRVVRWDREFNYSAVQNFAVSHARGEVLLFLNNDVEGINQDWFRQLLEHALRVDVGAVGGKLYYPDDTIQHAGVILGLGGIAGHAHHLGRRGDYGYFGRLIIIQNFSAVTAACMMMRRAVFEEVGGFDERFVLAFNDVDLCAKIRQLGYQVVWTPFAELYHYESLTRGHEDTPEKRARFRSEAEAFAERWEKLLKAGDPYYNPALTLRRSDFSVRQPTEGSWRLTDFLPPMDEKTRHGVAA